MFPEEIIKILEKYQSDNTGILDDINLSISTIKFLINQRILVLVIVKV